jgi:hypothetical protein
MIQCELQSSRTALGLESGHVVDALKLQGGRIGAPLHPNLRSAYV